MISFQNVTKKFDDFVAVDDISIDFEAGETIVLIGPSGCGKTTTLRMINHLVKATEGKITVDGNNIDEMDEVELRRNIGYVIQNVGLFPHMTIAENVSLVPYLKKVSKEDREKRARELLEFVGMPAEKFYDRYPEELSGGQQQRIGVARALASDPDIILMDEPFGALDPITRSILQDEFLQIRDELDKTIIFVTHDIDEALKLADKIVIMKDGKIVQYDTPENIIKNPLHGFVEEFLDHDSLLKHPEYIYVKDIMEKDPVTISPDSRYGQALAKIKKANVNRLAVVDDHEKFVGFVTLHHILNHLEDEQVNLEDIMKTDLPIITDQEMNVSQVLSLMADEKVGQLPVLDAQGKLLGVVTRAILIDILGKN